MKLSLPCCVVIIIVLALLAACYAYPDEMDNLHIYGDIYGFDTAALETVPARSLPPDSCLPDEAPVAEMPADTHPPAYLTAMNRALGWIREINPDPQVGSVGGEWAVIAFARAGVDDDAWFQKYLASLDDALTGYGGRIERMTDYARITLALTALGLDASDHNGHDFTAPLRIFTPHEDRAHYNRAINADIFALIALDSNLYDGDRTAYIEAILAAEAPDGGWGLSGNATPEITAMAITALAPYYDTDGYVRAAIGRAIQLIGGRQMRDAESNAQMIVALSALGRDAGAFVHVLLTFQDPETGAFKRGESLNMMATEQAAYALAAYYRFLSGENRLYDMSDALSFGG